MSWLATACKTGSQPCPPTPQELEVGVAVMLLPARGEVFPLRPPPLRCSAANICWQRLVKVKTTNCKQRRFLH